VDLEVRFSFFTHLFSKRSLTGMISEIASKVTSREQSDDNHDTPSRGVETLIDLEESTQRALYLFDYPTKRLRCRTPQSRLEIGVAQQSLSFP
jgi:hypothetical protein